MRVLQGQKKRSDFGGCRGWEALGKHCSLEGSELRVPFSSRLPVLFASACSRETGQVSELCSPALNPKPFGAGARTSSAGLWHKTLHAIRALCRPCLLPWLLTAPLKLTCSVAGGKVLKAETLHFTLPRFRPIPSTMNLFRAWGTGFMAQRLAFPTLTRNLPFTRLSFCNEAQPSLCNEAQQPKPETRQLFAVAKGGQVTYFYSGGDLPPIRTLYPQSQHPEAQHLNRNNN